MAADKGTMGQVGGTTPGWRLDMVTKIEIAARFYVFVAF